jgi:hypothetical protein
MLQTSLLLKSKPFTKGLSKTPACAVLFFKRATWQQSESILVGRLVVAPFNGRTTNITPQRRVDLVPNDAPPLLRLHLLKLAEFCVAFGVPEFTYFICEPPPAPLRFEVRPVRTMEL